MNYLEAHPGIRQVIGGKIFTIKRMYSEKKDAGTCVSAYQASKRYHECRIYHRIVNGKPFGKHPWCVAVRRRVR